MKWAAVNDDIGITIWVDDTLRVSPYGFKQSNLESMQSDHIRVSVRSLANLLQPCRISIEDVNVQLFPVDSVFARRAFDSESVSMQLHRINAASFEV